MIDPRLWRHSRPARGYILASVALSALSAAAIVVCALLIAHNLTALITGDTGWSLWWLGLAVGVRVAATWVQGRLAHRAAARVVADLERDVLAAAVQLPPRQLEARRDELVTVLTRGLAGLKPYLSGYIPALLLTVVTPPALLAVIAWADLTSAFIVAGTLPLIPIFMVLIGLLTRGRSQRSLQAMATLSGQLLDLLAGLPTLRALGREQGPQARIATLGQRHRRTAMGVLRIAFLSSMVLEMLATLCVALVAVSIGLRLVFGDMALEAGLLALILAPEVYFPLRAVGEKFHAAQDGKAAADLAFDVLDTVAARPVGSARVPDFVLDVPGVGCFEPGRLTVLTGPNGVGKSTALLGVLGLLPTEAAAGATVGGIPVGDVDLRWWWSQVGWLPQRPALVPGTLRDNLELFGPLGGDLDTACAATGFDRVLDTLAAGWDAAAHRLSLGERQRLALTRVLASARPILLLDEPTAHLDAESEVTVLDSLRALADTGATVVVVAHRPSVLARADVVLELKSTDKQDVSGPATDPVSGWPGMPASAAARPAAAAGRTFADPSERCRSRRAESLGTARGQDPLRRVLSLLELRPGRVAAAIVAGAAALGSALALATVAAWLIARAWQMPPVLDLTVAVVSVRALGISRGLCRYLERLLSHDTAFRAATSARVRIYEALARSDAVTALRSGSLFTRTGEDVDTVAAVVVRAIVPMAVGVLVSGAAVVIVATIAPLAAGVLAGCLIVAGVVVPVWYSRSVRDAERAAATARAEYDEHVATALEHSAELRVAGRLDDVAAGAAGAADVAVAAEDRAAPAAAFAGVAVPLGTGIAVLVALLVAATTPASPMGLAILVLVPLAAFEAVAAMPAAMLSLVRARASAERIVELLDADAAPPAPLDWTPAPGARIAVVGPSGSGKTTLLRRLPGTFFAEDAHVFATTVLENLRVGRGDLTHEQAADVCARVGLDLQVDRLLVGGAAGLSGGQRRRLLLARALVTPTDVLLLDEPTEHMDAADGAALLRALLDRTSGLVEPGRTVVVVTHQLPPNHGADHVVSLPRPDGFPLLGNSFAATEPGAYVGAYTRKEVVQVE